MQYFDFFGKRWLKFTETTWYEADDSHELLDMHVTPLMPSGQAVEWLFLVSDQVFFVQLRDRIAAEG